MPISPFMAAINQICDEKGLPKETVLETVEAAIAAAYRKDYGEPNQIIKAKMDPESGLLKYWQVHIVVEEVKNPEAEITLVEAKKKNKKAKIGDEIETPLKPHSEFGRIAAQTAKQVVTQRIREAERDVLYKEYKNKEKQLINGTVQQIEGRNIIVDLGRITGLMLPMDQIPSEKYYIGQRLKVYLKGVEQSARGPRILVSRSAPEFITELFADEVPEIPAGTVEIKGTAREAGSRSKVAVTASQEGLDPVGSCVGQRGMRVQAVLAEISGEKIDIIQWDKDLEKYIINALSPAKISKVKLDKKNQVAKVTVVDDQLSLAIGKGGQNVRLASKLCGWSIDIEKEIEKETKKKEVKKDETKKVKAKKSEEPKKKEPKKSENLTEKKPDNK